MGLCFIEPIVQSWLGELDEHPTHSLAPELAYIKEDFFQDIWSFNFASPPRAQILNPQSPPQN